MKLWLAIRDRRLDGFKFVRQFAIGPYVVDFICREHQVIVEVDGGQHAESARDAVRDQALMKHGYTVLRFWNHDVLGNLEGVLTVMLAALKGATTP